MVLCELCKSISFKDLPVFPDDEYDHSITGFPFLQMVHLRRRRKNKEHPDLGVRYHLDLNSLRRAAAGGCELCRLVETQADGILNDIADDKVRLLQYAPTFEMWVSKRPAFGDGLWIVTKDGGPDWGDTACIPVATLGFCADEGDTRAANFEARRPKPPLPHGAPDPETLSRLIKFVGNCDENHAGCAHPKEPSQMPSRLLDVSPSGAGDRIRLIELEPRTVVRYAALSYCWGDGVGHLTSTRATIVSRRDQIHFHQLPRTFRDAVLVARALGVRYLWIDSLCICQDDHKDWERESARMAAVYTNAYLTLAATGGQDCNAGLFRCSTLGPYIQLPYDTVDGAPSSVWTYPLDMRKEIFTSEYINMSTEPLSKRGWAFQERVLSRRLLLFASDQIHFECLQGVVAETGLKMDWRYHSVHLERDLELPSEKGQEDEETTKRTSLPSSHIDQAPTIMSRWLRLVRAYGDGKLTFPSDKLPALSGIAKLYSEMLNDEYVAGLWKKSILEGLSWQALGCKLPPDGKYRAPSWSWASVDGTASGGYAGQREPVATVLNCSVELKGENPFGEVTGGRIEMEAPLVPLVLSETQGPTGHIYLRTEKGDPEGMYAGLDTISRAHKDSAELLNSMPLYSVVLVRLSGTERSETESHYFSLIVTPAEGAEGSMKRVGFLIHADSDLGPDDLKLRETFTLV